MLSKASIFLLLLCAAILVFVFTSPPASPTDYAPIVVEGYLALPDSRNLTSGKKADKKAESSNFLDGKWHILAVNLTDSTTTTRMPTLWFPNYDWMRPIDYSVSHPFENTCRYPVLNKLEPDIEKIVQHHRTFKCSTAYSERTVAVHQDKTGEIYIRQLKNKTGTVKCYASQLHGAVRPKQYTYKTGGRFEVPFDRPFLVGFDQFSIECFIFVKRDNLPDEKKNMVYNNAFNWIPPLPSVIPPASNVPEKYSIVIIAIESTSRSQFLRHMPLTYKFLQDTGFYVFNGYNKVGDNSLINLNSVLTGRVFKASHRGFDGLISKDVAIPAGLIGIERYPTSLIARARTGGMATMWNDEIGKHAYGLYHYFGWYGFQNAPADYYFRPYYEYIYKNKNAQHKYCDSDGPFISKYAQPIASFSTRYANQTHFSFTFLSRQTHEDPNNLELYDTTMLQVLTDLKIAGVFENTVIMLIGDHGQRMHPIQKTYSGRIEERSPFLGLYLPPKFIKAHPEKAANVRINQNRLISNFDVFETLSDVLDITFRQPKHLQTKNHGTSLFDRIPVNRDCKSAMIPENFCLCMEPPDPFENQNLTQGYGPYLPNVIESYFNSTIQNLSCVETFSYSNMSVPKFWTISSMARSGVRYMEDKWKIVMRETAEIEFTLDLALKTRNKTKTLRGKATVRLMWWPTKNKLEMNVSPLVKLDACPRVFALQSICTTCQNN